MNELRILILPPGRRDGDATGALLQRAGMECHVFGTAADIARELDGGAGALVTTDTALAAPGFDIVRQALSRQPAVWSDIPVILLCQPGPRPDSVPLLSSFTNVTLLDRPTSARTLVSAVQTALRSRLRQYQTRDHLEALRVAEETLRTADRRKDEFLAMLAHELRNPLAPIRNASELLIRIAPENPQMQAATAIVKRQITQLSRLVDDLLDVSRITQGRIELQQLPVELSSVISQAMESVEPFMREKRHTVLAATGYGPLHVKGDNARLVQCIANILTNSAKYTHPGGEIRIDVRAERSGEQTLAVIVITDNGVGIPRDLLPRIFDLFVQSDRSLDRSQGGLGIGLSVVRRLIEMHGGQVSAHSGGPGRGARFEVRLPVLAELELAREDPVTQSSLAKRILVVDDNVDAGDSLAMVLNLSGHTAEAVYDPLKALERAASFDPEVILLDIGLPGMDGYEVARRIRARGSTARLVALTGYGQSEDIRRTQAAGFDAHLVKPVELEHLLHNLDGPRH